MTLLRRVLRKLRPVVETLLAGVLLGVVVTGLAAQVAANNAQSATSAEVPLARSYMLAFVKNDTATMAKLNPSGDVVTQAIAFQQLVAASSTITFPTVTYLGGSAIGSFGVHVYIVQVEGANGTSLVPFAITLVKGHVALLRGLTPANNQ